MLPHGEKGSFFSESMTHPLSSRLTLFLFQPDHRHPVPSFVALPPPSPTSQGTSSRRASYSAADEQALERIHPKSFSLRIGICNNGTMAKSNNILLYLLRHDLRLSDNPVFHRLASNNDHGFTHLLPVYVFAAHQIEVSGFIKDGSPSPYPEARSTVSKVWRTGPHRAKFIVQSVWNLKENLESVGSGLVLRAGKPSDAIQSLIEGLNERGQHVGAVWLTAEEGVEERKEQKAVSVVCHKLGADFKLWEDEKFYIDE